ncbi:hypothetical protein C8R43DRAFT_1150681 [Mycena crocata]|nr:hypothetical protein C8R43DRAFT_1150681 [Mycena crocata]
MPLVSFPHSPDMALSNTPTFRNYRWMTTAMQDGSWKQLTEEQLLPEFTPFLLAMQQLDTAAFPHESADSDVMARRRALGLAAGPASSSDRTKFSTGEGQIWATLLHFQVLDLVLCWRGFPRTNHKTPLSSASPTLTNKNAKFFVKSLVDWTDKLADLEKDINEDIDDMNTSSDPAATSDVSAESWVPLLALAQIKGGTRKARTYKNLQAIAAALVYIFELGTNIAPVKPADYTFPIDPKSKVTSRYSGLSALSQSALSTITVEQLLRPLSYAINFSSLVAFTTDKDLQNVHIDLETQFHMRQLLAFRESTGALQYMEQGIYNVIRAACAAKSVEHILKAEFNHVRKSMPVLNASDTEIFCDLLTRFEKKTPRRSTQLSSQGTSLPPAMPYMAPQIKINYAINSGPIARALSVAPGPAVRQRSVQPEMTLFSDLDVDSRTNLALGLVAAATPTTTSKSATTEPVTIAKHVNTGPETIISPPVAHSISGSPPDVPMSPISELTEHNSAAGNLRNPDETGPNSSEAEVEMLMVDDSPPAAVNSTAPERRASRRLADAPAIDPATIPARMDPGVKKPARAAKKRRLDEVDSSPGDEHEKEPDAVEDELVLLGLDSEWFEPSTQGWINELPQFPDGVQRSGLPEPISCFLPNGRTERSFDYISHPAAERSEYKLIYDVHQSMQAVNKRCLKDGVRFPTYTGGMIPSPPSSDDSYLLTISLGDWTSMSELERVKLWATGLDLYIFGMDSGPKTENIREAVTRLHRLDAPVEVQVQALRISSDDENANIDYTSSIRTTTLRNVLDNAERVDGLVLNVLKLPSGHMVRKNPLLDSGLDLEAVAYRMTNGLTGFAYKDPPYNEMYWELIGLAHSFSPCHFDVAASRVFVAGPGEKFWIRSRTRALEARLADGVDPRKDDITDSVAFDGWDPTIASTESCEYEGCVLPAGEGVLLMQPGRKHLVVGTDTGENGRGPSRTATLTTGGHFFCASSIRPSMCIILHMVMLQHILTNAEYVGMWPVMIRICAFWLDVTLNRPTGDLIPLAAYIPDLELPHAEGWLDIIYLSSIIVLLPALDVRTYNESPHVDIPTERDYTVDSYQNWRKSLAKRFVCFKSGKKVHWEKDIFTPVLLHLAVTMAQYHRRQSIRFPDAEAYQYFTTEKLEQNIQHVLKGYDAKLPARFQKQVHEKQESTRLFLLDDAELEILRI